MFGYAPEFDDDYFSSPAFQEEIARGIGNSTASDVPAAAPVAGIGSANTNAYGLSDADMAALANFDPSKINLAGLGGLNLTGGTYDGETKSFTAPKSNKGNATSRINSRDNTFDVAPSSTIRVVSGGQVIYEGKGYDGAAQAIQTAQKLSDEYGNSANWDIAVNTPGVNNSANDFSTVAHEKVNITAGQIAVGVLNAAVQIGLAVATSGMSLPAQAAISAGAAATLTLAEGGSLTDALKAGVMAAAPVVGAKELGKVIQAGTNAAGKVVATTLGAATGAGLSTTAAGLLTGKNLESALLSGAISAAGQVLAAELAAKSPKEVADLVTIKNADLAATLGDISDSLANQFAEAGLNATSLGAGFASNLGGIAEGADRVVTAITGSPNIPVAPTVSGIGRVTAAQPDIQSDIMVNAKSEPAAPVTQVAVAPSVVAGIGGTTAAETTPETIVNAKPGEETAIAETPTVPATTGIGGTTAANNGPEIVATGQRTEPLYEVPAAIPATTGIGGIISPEILVRARTEDTAVNNENTASPAVTGIGGTVADNGPEIVSTGQRTAEASTNEEPVNPAAVAPSGLEGDILVNAKKTADVKEEPALSATMTDIGNLLNSDEMQNRYDEEANRPPEEKKSTWQKIKDAAEIASVASTIIPLAAEAIGGGGGGITRTPDTSGINFTKTTLRPTIPGDGANGAGGAGNYGGIGGVGGRYPYNPLTYGRVGGDQETEYLFFTHDPITGEPAVTAAPPGERSAPPGKKEGGEIEDDMVKHLVEYHKNGGHNGPGHVKGIGSGQEDKIPAWLSDGEYVWSAQDVADLGDGSTDEGVRRLDKMREMVRRQAGRKDVKKIAKPQKGIDKMLKAVGGLA